MFLFLAYCKVLRHPSLGTFCANVAESTKEASETKALPTDSLYRQLTTIHHIWVFLSFLRKAASSFVIPPVHLGGGFLLTPRENGVTVEICPEDPHPL